MFRTRSVCSARILRLSPQSVKQETCCHSSWTALRRYLRWQWNTALIHRRPAKPEARGAASAATILDSKLETHQQEKPAFRAHIDFQALKAHLPRHVQNVKDRNSSAKPEIVVQLYDQWVHLLGEVEHLRAERNANAKSMKERLEVSARAQLVAQGKQLKEQLSLLEVLLHGKEAELQREAQKLPNLTHPQAPVGDEDAAVLLKTVGSKPYFSFQPQDHLALGERLGLIDFEAGARVTGAKFVYLCKAAAQLEMALCNYAFQKVISKGYTPVCTPDLVKAAVLQRCGFQPRAESTQVYSLEGSDMCLTGTAEVPLGGLLMDKIIMEEELPIRMVAFGHCFRAESGSAGSASKGLYRVHQFSKVEMFTLGTEEQSDHLLAELCHIEEEIFTELGLHYQMLDMPTSDLGAPAFRKIDIEAWMPGLDRYGEISSASNCTDYQARRLNIRYRPSQPLDGSKRMSPMFVHTLNGTACAAPRLIVALMENNQLEDGSILIPGVLQPYLGGMTIIQR